MVPTGHRAEERAHRVTCCKSMLLRLVALGHVLLSLAPLSRVKTRVVLPAPDPTLHPLELAESSLGVTRIVFFISFSYFATLF